MTRARVAAAAAALVSALLVQAAVIAPVTAPWPVSLPAVLIAAVALHDGAATGMAFGFAAGLVADLGSRHPAGLLALCWLGLGLLCGALADRRSIRRDALVGGALSSVAGAAATLLVAVTHDALRHDAGLAGEIVGGLVPAALGNAGLAVVVVAVARRMLRTDSLRAPQPVSTRFSAGVGPAAGESIGLATGTRRG